MANNNKNEKYESQNIWWNSIELEKSNRIKLNKGLFKSNFYL